MSPTHGGVTKWRSIVSVAAWIVAGSSAAWLALDHALLAAHAVTIALQVAAAALMLWARVTFGIRSFHVASSATEGALVTRGPFRFVRNPIYASAILFAVAGVIDHVSALHVAACAAAVGALVVRALLEERDLVARYGDAYSAYAARTARLVPFLFVA